ncbi:MAG: MFS transporter [Sandarakinorhabdus sp.]|nr:MFS transporter [Sandarakinorhabdus sp.]
MTDLTLLIIAISIFVGGHEILSHPLRAPLVRIVGEKGFALVYSVVALGSLYWAVQLWKGIAPERLWQLPPWANAVALVAMLFAFILFVGSMTSPNPALMGMKPGGSPRGVQRITRHPMMWSFAIWAIVHIAMSADPRTIVLASGILTLALFGASMQDKKKRASTPGYGDHIAATGFVPFGAQLRGRAAWSGALPGLVAMIGGLLLWVVVLWAHPLVIGLPAVQIG